MGNYVYDRNVKLMSERHRLLDLLIIELSPERAQCGNIINNVLPHSFNGWLWPSERDFCVVLTNPYCIFDNIHSHTNEE